VSFGLARLPEGAGRFQNASSRGCAPEGYEQVRASTPAQIWSSSTLATSRQRQGGIFERDRQGAEGKTARSSSRLHGRRAREHFGGVPRCAAITGPQQYESVVDAVHRAVAAETHPFLDLVPRKVSSWTPRHYAYLKIRSCNNRCTFCIIPKLRGIWCTSRRRNVLREAEKLVTAA